MRCCNTSRRWLISIGLVLLLGGIALVLPAARVAAATTYTVTVLTDTGAGAGTTGDLRYAITQVNAGAGGDTINITAHGTITLGSKLPVLNRNVTIAGPGASLLTINGNHAVRAFEIAGSVAVNLSGITIANGFDSLYGGAIYVGADATLTVAGSIFTGNTADGGGAITNIAGSTVTVTNCTFSGNQSTGGKGGAIFNTGKLTVTGSAFTNNASSTTAANLPARGAGTIYSDDGNVPGDGATTITNSTFVGNNVTGIDGGAAITGWASGQGTTLTLINVTITGNSADRYGTGGVRIRAFVSATNTIISGNTSVTPQIQDVAPVGSFGGATTSIIGGAPLLGTLGDHGGPTQTVPLLPGSPTIGAGTTGGSVPTTDQRGVARTGHNDIGAFQSQGFTITKTGGDGQSARIVRPFASPLTLTVAANAAGAPWNEPVQGGSLTVTVPSSGPSASVATPTFSLPANGLGSVTATANAVVGGPYSVTVGAGNAFTASFSLTNAPAPARTTYTVGTAADQAAGQTSAAVCTTATNTTCTLRDAVSFAQSGTDTVLFNSTGRGTITLGSKLPVLTNNVTITGPGASLLTIDGIHTVRAFEIASGATLNLSGVTIYNGYDMNYGGAIYVSANATLAVTNSTFSHNEAYAGGAIYSAGTLTVTNSVFTNRNAGYERGGAITNDGTLTVTNSTFSNGSAGLGGGAVYNAGTTTVTNSTFSGNSTNQGGAAIFTTGTLTVTNCTITGNKSFFKPGTVTNSGGGTERLTNTIVAVSDNGEGTSVPDLAGTITSGGHNLFGDITGATITLATGDLVNPNPLVGTLGDYGGPTQTVPLLPGSPAIGNGDPAVCAAIGVGKVNGVDQRGFLRPTACAMGAYEANPPLPSPLPGPKPPGPVGGSPNPLPGARPPGQPSGPAPNPVPAARP